MNRPRAPGSFSRRRTIHDKDKKVFEGRTVRKSKLEKEVKKEESKEPIPGRTQSCKLKKSEGVVEMEDKRSASWELEPRTKMKKVEELRGKPPPVPQRKPSIKNLLDEKNWTMKKEVEENNQDEEYDEEYEGEYGEYEEEGEIEGVDQPDILNISLPTEFSQQDPLEEEELEVEEYVAVPDSTPNNNNNNNKLRIKKKKRGISKVMNPKQVLKWVNRKKKKKTKMKTKKGNEKQEEEEEEEEVIEKEKEKEKEPKMSNSKYIRRILKFVSDQRFYVEPIKEEFETVFYRPFDLSCRQRLPNLIKLNTLKKEYIQELFVEKSLCDKLFLQFSKGDSESSDLLNLFELMYLPGPSYIFSKNAKYKYIKTNEGAMKSFVYKYRSIFVAEPSTLCKAVFFIRNQNEIEYEIERIQYQYKVSFTIEDCLFLLRHSKSKKIRDLVLTTISRCREDELEILVKSMILLLQYTSQRDNLSQFLVSISQRTISLWSTVNWELILESKQFDCQFYRNLLQNANQKPEYGVLFDKQVRLVEKIQGLNEELRKRGEKRRKKMEIFRDMLRDVQRWRDVFNLGRESMFLPFNTKDTKLVGFYHEESRILKSAKLPLFLTFRTVGGGKYKVLYKYGDDLRMDMLVMNMVRFMDMILKLHNLDLDVVSFRVMGTSYKSGFIEIVEDSETITWIQDNYGPSDSSIRDFLMDCAGDEEEYNMAVQKFKNSMAAYCVISYLLGIGDRHLDNLMVKFTGEIFHVDFSFLFGKDPKPMPPKMRITKDMIEVLNGISGGEFMEFQILLCKTYNVLRRHSYSIIGIVNSLVDANIPHVNEESVRFLVKRLKLDLKEEEANVHILSVFYKSLRSIFPKINEKFHQMAMKIRD